MPVRLPSEYFREGSEAGSVELVEAASTTPPRSPGTTTRHPRWGEAVAPRLVIAGILGALLLGFGIGRLLLLDGDSSQVGEASSPGATSTSSVTSIPTLVPYAGAVRVLPVLLAEGPCRAQSARDMASSLIDDDPNSFWRCPGAGVGETITFRFDPGQPVVGVRLVNGNTVGLDRYLTERRILSIRWTFADGSWVVQGLSANDRQPQEVRFPPVQATSSVTMTIMEATVAGGADESDAVSIASLDFLTVA